MKKLGISIYPEIVGEKKTIEYIKLANKNGFTRIFANLLELKNNAEGHESLRMRTRVYKYASEKLKMDLIVDVNPTIYKEFSLPKNELIFFKNMGATGIRLDEDFNGVIEAQLSNNKLGMMIELNASSGTSTFDKTLKLGGKAKYLIACHNFYPMRWTGLDFSMFLKLSTYFKTKGIRVAAFITLPSSQKGIGPWKINEGMPTIEEHRDLSIEQQVMQMMIFDVVDDIILSQQGATEKQFKSINSLLKIIYKVRATNILNIKMNVEENLSKVEKEIILFSKNKLSDGSLISTHTNRPDITSYFIRSTMPRILFKSYEIKPKNIKKYLVKGDVVILNESIGRYKGELHIIKRDMINTNGSRNFVGKICEKDFILIDSIEPGANFSLKIV